MPPAMRFARMNWREAFLYAAAILLTAVIFAADLYLDHGYVATMGYCGSVLLAVATRNRHFALSMAGLCSALTFAGGAARPEPFGPAEWMSHTSRAFTLCMAWLVTVLGMQRRTARIQLGESTSRLETIVETAVDAIITIDERGRILSFNGAAERLFGYQRDEVSGKNVRMLMPAPYRQEHDGYIARYLETGEKRIIGIGREVVGQRRDGSTFPLDLAVSETVFGDRRIFTGIIRDITERKAVERRLMESEGRLRAIVETAVDAIITIDERGSILTFNQAAERLFGYGEAEVAGRNIKMLMPSPFREEHDEYLARYLRTGEKRIIGIGREVVGQRKDGSTFPLDLAVSETLLDGGRIFTGIIRDITDRKRAEERLHKLITDLARSNAELENFAFAIAHDLRTPLMSINGCAQLLVQACSPVVRDNPDGREAAEYIKTAVSHMDRLLRHLLEYSRIGQGGLRIKPSSCESAFERAVTNLKAYIERTGAVITHDPLPLVLADDALLAQVFQNLIENGIKYCDAQPPRVHVSSRKLNGEWAISVRDNGIGIPPSYHAQIFRPFHRLYQDESKYEGTGIGLAVCKKIVEQHGGRIWVESAPGQGATFSFSLPAPRPEILMQPDPAEAQDRSRQVSTAEGAGG